jgi:hypothetical protein
MVNNCANPQCAKPLHYLREGRVFVFEISGSGTGVRQLEHYWLCGECSKQFLVERTNETGTHLVPRRRVSAVTQGQNVAALAS